MIPGCWCLPPVGQYPSPVGDHRPRHGPGDTGATDTHHHHCSPGQVSSLTHQIDRKEGKLKYSLKLISTAESYLKIGYGNIHGGYNILLNSRKSYLWVHRNVKNSFALNSKSKFLSTTEFHDQYKHLIQCGQKVVGPRQLLPSASNGSKWTWRNFTHLRTYICSYATCWEAEANTKDPPIDNSTIQIWAANNNILFAVLVKMKGVRCAMRQLRIIIFLLNETRLDIWIIHTSKHDVKYDTIDK